MKKTASVATFNLDTWAFLHTRDVRLFAWFIVFNVTFNNNSHMSWRSASLVAKPEYPEKTIDLPQVTDTHILLYRQYFARNGVRTHNFSGDSLGLYR